MQVTTINTASTQVISHAKEQTTRVSALHNAFLSELPGMAFAVLTLVYIVSSLVRL